MKIDKFLAYLVRFTGTLQLVSGIVFWTGTARSLVMAHVALGSLLTLALLVLAYRAFRAQVSLPLVLLAAAWALGLPAWAQVQGKVFPAAYLWAAQVLHLVCGIGAMGLAEMLAVQLRERTG